MGDQSANTSLHTKPRQPDAPQGPRFHAPRPRLGSATIGWYPFKLADQPRPTISPASQSSGWRMSFASAAMALMMACDILSRGSFLFPHENGGSFIPADDGALSLVFPAWALGPAGGNKEEMLLGCTVAPTVATSGFQ